MTTEKPTRKQEILDAALFCFNQHGIATATIEMIRERCGASVGSIYHHFGNKESIGSALYVQAMRDYHVGFQAMLGGAQTVEEGVKAVPRSYIDWVAQHPELARFVLYSRGHLAKTGLTGALEQDNEANFAFILKWFKPHIASGALKKLPTECYGSLLLGAAHDYARLWLSGRAKTPILAFREIFADAAWGALRA